MTNRKKKKQPEPPVIVGRRFLIKRKIDDSGISGTGYVAFGIEWPSKKVTIEWIVGEHISQENHNTLEDCMAIHGHGDHSLVEWIDGITLQFPRG